MLQPIQHKPPANPLVREPTRLRDAWNLIRSLRPTAPQRQGAEDLGVTEAELVAAHVGDNAVRLRPHWAALLGDLVQLGAVQGLTRNDHAVIEVEGVYREAHIDETSIRVRDTAIDVHAFTRDWDSAFAVRELGRFGVRSSLQFFDRCGASAHKIFLRPHSAECAFDAIANLYADSEQVPVAESVVPSVPRGPLGRCPQVNVGELRRRWARLPSVEDADALLAEIGAERVQALRLLGEPHARRAPNSAILRALEIAAVRYVSLGVAVASAAAVQRYSGTVLNVKPVAGWINVLDETFNFHVRASSIAETWVVSTPTADEPIATLEAYDHDGQVIATVAGVSELGPFEYERWLAITDELTF